MEELVRLLKKMGCLVVKLHDDEPADLICVNRAHRTVVIWTTEGGDELKMNEVPLEFARIGVALGTPMVAWKPDRNPGYPHGWVFIPVLGVRRKERVKADELPPCALDVRTVATQPVSPV